MKIKEAISVMDAEIQGFYSWPQASPLILEAMMVAIQHAEATRWRKLSEEQPPDKTEWYETWEIDHATPELALHKALWCQSPGTEKWEFKDRRVRWWAHIIGPEENK